MPTSLTAKQRDALLIAHESGLLNLNGRGYRNTLRSLARRGLIAWVDSARVYRTTELGARTVKETDGSRVGSDATAGRQRLSNRCDDCGAALVPAPNCTDADGNEIDVLDCSAGCGWARVMP